MLTHLRIKNFKSWRDTGEIRLAPLTVFFGANSSGKSSINQFLMMLKQTVESSDRQTVLNLGRQNTAVELGTFRDVVHQHQVEEGIEFELGEWKLKETRLTAPDEFSTIRVRDTSWNFRFSAALGLSEDSQENIVVRQMFYQLEHQQPLKSRLDIGMRREGGGYLLTRSVDEEMPTSAAKYMPPIHFYGFPFPPDVQVTEGKTGLDLANLTWNLETQLRNIYYLGGLREPPQRLYLRTGGQPESVGWHGEKAIEVLLLARNERVLKPVANWLKMMGLLESFEVNKIAPHRQEYEVSVKTRATEKSVNLTEVGMGVAQILPVIVQCFYAPPHSTTLIEQPEAHLHPSAQSALADLFIDAVQAVDDRKGQFRRQLVIESHSEHFLRRLQRRLAEEKIHPEEVAIYVCESTPAGSILKPLAIDEYGNINNWPANFFGDDTGDLIAMTEAAMKRQMETEVNAP